LPIDLRINPINKEVKQGDGHFGYVRDSGEKRHEGVDFAAPIGTPVLAVKDGTVIYKDASDKGYGNQVVIQHTDGTLTVYAHLRSIKDASGKYVSPVMEGQFVKAGQKIGEVGTTGNVGRAASHLHFETRYSSVVDDNYGQKKDNRTTIHPLYLFRGSGITIDGEKL
jgi:murein DD-endopeptidase MepM/ murein hydrolase activator NlpD